jgi:hypothetical protein
MPRLRRLTVAAAGAALVAGPLAALTPSATATETSGSATETRGVTLVMQCNVGRPYGSFGHMSIYHDIPFPGRAKWREVYHREQSCMYRNPRAKLKVASYRGAGSWRAINNRVDRARSRPGFRLQQLHRHGAPFDDNTDRTRVAEFTFRNANGKRQHVRMVGDKYTLMWVRSSQRAWNNGIGKTANRAHRGTSRLIAIAM